MQILVVNSVRLNIDGALFTIPFAKSAVTEQQTPVKIFLALLNF